MAKKRVTRKQLLKEPDEFITTTGRVVQWARENSKILTYGCATFAGIVVLIAAVSYYQERQDRKSAILLGSISAKYENLVQAGQQEEALAAVRDDFQKLIDGYAGRPAGRLGRLVYAHYCLANGNYDDAITHYRTALNDYSGDPSLQNIILNGLGSAFQQKGQDDAAADTYAQLVATDSPVLKDAALFNLGIIYDRQGNSDGVKVVYQQLITDFPDSMYAAVARERV